MVTIAPDYSPSAIHADYHLPVRIGTDAALALAMCKVIIDAGLYDKRFVQEQTDLPLLVRKDTGRFLRGDEVYEGEREDQFFWWDSLSGTLTPAPRHTLATTGTDPALEGSYQVMLKDLSTVEVEPVFARLLRHLEDYTPEKAGEICQLHPENIRKLARKVATRKTKIFIGWNSGKYYHGDLMERSMALLLGLTGNWGKKGTGTRSWAFMGMDGEIMMAAKEGPGQEAAQKHIQSVLMMRRMMAASDPTQTKEMVQNRMLELVAETGGVMGSPIPPAFLWYYQEGYKERWNDPENNCPTMKRSYDEYVERGDREGLVGRALLEGLPDGRAARALRGRGQLPAAQPRRPEAPARALLAQAHARGLGRLPHHHHRPLLRLHPAGSPALREARPGDSLGAPPELGADRPRRRASGQGPARPPHLDAPARGDRAPGRGARDDGVPRLHRNGAPAGGLVRAASRRAARSTTRRSTGTRCSATTRSTASCPRTPHSRCCARRASSATRTGA